MALGQPSIVLVAPMLRRRLLSISLALLLTLVVYLVAFSDRTDKLCYACLPDFELPEFAQWSAAPSSTDPPPPTSLENLTLPDLDDLPPPLFPPPGRDVGYCRQHFSGDYLSDLRDHSIEYCEGAESGGENEIKPAQSRSRLTCFHGYIRDNKNADSFCIGNGVKWDAENNKFALDCPVRRVLDENETARGLIPFTSLQPYWFSTGPKRVFEEFVSMDAKVEETRQGKTDVPPSFVLLVKREGAGNLWHCLMEIWSMAMTMDVLRMSRQEDSGKPFYDAPADEDNTHVVILDDHGPGPTLDLWRFFSKRPIVTYKDMKADPAKVPAPLRSPSLSSSTNIVVPLPGGSNPLWHNDWIVRDCTPSDAPLLQLFVQRVFSHFDVPQLEGPKTNKDGKEPVVVTVIDRRQTRRLLNIDALLTALRQRFPSPDNVVIQSIDMATLSLPDQLRLVQDTDVLVGVHGAGLTHTMFMRRGAGTVVEIQPEGLGYKGFRNLAAMTGHRYFSAEAEIVERGEEREDEKDEAEKKEKVVQKSKDGKVDTNGKEGARRRGDPAKPWQSSNVRMEEGRFLELMDVAIKSVYNEGLRNEFVV